MDDRDLLLRAVRSDPDAPGARLVDADWLQEDGPPARGEFIRRQCDLETMAPGIRACRPSRAAFRAGVFSRLVSAGDPRRPGPCGA
jgi:uncharacterized protein (TIGR02996 family)